MTTTDHDAFLRAILESPDDDAPRLICADWLDDHGDADRAEFIRVQCALAGSAANGRRREVEIRELELLDRRRDDWAGPIRRLVEGFGFRRGFVGQVRVSGKHFAENTEAILRAAPVQEVQLYWGAEHPAERASRLARACACPDLARLRVLHLEGNYLGSDGTRALAACEYLAGLTVLDLSGNKIGPAGVKALASAPFLSNLTDLKLADNDIGPTGIRALVAAVRQPGAPARPLRLQHLDLRNNRLGAAGRQLIFSEPLLRRVAIL